MKIIINSLAILFLIFFLSSGCASIVSKSDYPVSISSSPSGVEFVVKNNSGQNIFAGQTPSTINLNAGAGFFKGANYSVTFKKDGSATHTAQISRAVDGWYIAGNLVFGGLIGWLIVDPATGAMWKLDNLHVELNNSLMSSKTNNLNIISIDEVPEKMRSRMVKLN